MPDAHNIGNTTIVCDKKDYERNKIDTIHFDTKQFSYCATPLCGLGGVYSQYTVDTKEVSCKKCVKLLNKKEKK